MGLLGKFLRSSKRATKGLKKNASGELSNDSRKASRRKSKSTKKGVSLGVIVDEQDEVDFTSSATFDTDSLSTHSDEEESVSVAQEDADKRASAQEEDQDVVVLEGALPLSILDVLSPGWNTQTKTSPPERRKCPANPRQRLQLAFKANWEYATDCEITEWKWEKQIVRDRRKNIENKRNEDRSNRLKAKTAGTPFERDFIPFHNVHSRQMLQCAIPEVDYDEDEEERGLDM